MNDDRVTYASVSLKNRQRSLQSSRYLFGYPQGLFLPLLDKFRFNCRFRGIDRIIDLLLDPVEPGHDISKKCLDLRVVACIRGGFMALGSRAVADPVPPIGNV